MPTCFVLEPEVAGGLGPGTEMDSSEHPPRVRRLHIELEGWLGDDLIESYPCFVATDRCRRALEQGLLTGFRNAEVEVSKATQFNELYPGRALPAFWWLQVHGEACKDDLGLAGDGRLVVSMAALNILRTLNLAHCDVSEYQPR
jgi:hypothetical protein